MIEVTEEEKDLRIALYEYKKENPSKTYSEIAKEFGIRANKAKDLIFKYCKAFNLDLPATNMDFSSTYKKFEGKLKGEIISIENRQATVINELTNTIIVRFLDNNEAETIRKSDMKIMRPKYLRGSI